MSQIAGRHLAFEVAVRCVQEQRRGEVRCGEVRRGWISGAVQISREVNDHVVRHMKKQRCTVHVTYATETGGNAGGR